MKKIGVIVSGLLLIAVSGYAGDGDLIVNGKLGLGTDNPTGVFEIAGQFSSSATDAIPTMTSSTTPSGLASASSELLPTYPAWKAMNDDNANVFMSWVSAENIGFPQWLQYQFPTGKTVTSYSVTSRNYVEPYNFPPTAWKLQGSNGGAWTDLDTRTGQSFVQNERKTYSFSNTTSYTSYRLYITAGSNSTVVSIGEWELMESGGTNSASMFYVDETTGHVGIWSTNPGSYKLYVNGPVYASSYSGSDQRWKKNIQPIHQALSLVEKLKGVRFEYRTEEFKNKHFEKGQQIGLIAQEVEPVIPEIVKTDQDGYKAISYEKLTAVLIEAIKEQHLTIKEQNAKIKELEAKINKMKKEKEH